MRIPLGIRLLARLLPREDREVFLGDLQEEYQEHVLPRMGKAAARRWFWRMALGGIAAGVGDRIGVLRRPTRRSSFDGGERLMGWMSETRKTIRGLLKTPGFSLTVMATIALGVGATTAIFSVAWGVLLAPLPYEDAGQIVNVSEEFEDGSERAVTLSFVNGSDWIEANRTFERLARVTGAALTLTGSGDAAEVLPTMFIDPDYLEILGARAAQGRLFGPADNVSPGAHPVVIVSDQFWEDRFGRDPGLVGRSLNLSGRPYTVVGVLSPDHQEPFGTGANTEVTLWVPAMMAGQTDPRGDAVLTNRRFRIFGAIGRLLPGVTPEEAEADLDRIARGLEELYPEINGGFGSQVQGLQQLLSQNLDQPVRILLIGALVLLLIGCFNVANLLLVRGASREKEMAVQLALGAGRGGLFRKVLTESLVLAIAGGGVGVLLADTALPFLLELLPQQLPPTAQVGLNLQVVLVAVGASLLSGVIFGLIPAFKVSGVDLHGPLSGSGRTVADRKGERARTGLVLVEIATATVLLTATGLLVQSFRAIRSVESGFESNNVLSVTVALSPTRYPGLPDMSRAIRDMTDRLNEVPGIDWAHPWGPGRPGQSGFFQTTIPDGMVVEDISGAPLARRHQIAPGTLEDFGIEILAGRDFDANDQADAPLVAIVNQQMADDRWPGEDPIGKRIHAFVPPGTPIDPTRSWTVIGVAADARHGGRIQPTNQLSVPFDIYYPMSQRPERQFRLMIHGAAGLPTPAPIREAIAAFDPDIPVFAELALDEAIAQEESPARFAALLMALFGIAALLLAALGVYGVLAFAVSERRREIGLRAALGAESSRTLTHFVMRGVRLAGAGVVVGGVVAVGLGRVARSTVASLPAMDLRILLAACVLLTTVSVLACLIPAFRATRVSPNVALKE